MIKEEDFPEALIAARLAINAVEDVATRSQLNRLLNQTLGILEAPTWDKYGRAWAEMVMRFRGNSNLSQTAPREKLQVSRIDASTIEVIDTRGERGTSMSMNVTFDQLPYKIDHLSAGQISNRTAAVCFPVIAQEHICNPVDAITEAQKDELEMVTRRKIESGASVFSKV